MRGLDDCRTFLAVFGSLVSLPACVSCGAFLKLEPFAAFGLFVCVNGSALRARLQSPASLPAGLFIGFSPARNSPGPTSISLQPSLSFLQD